VDEVNLLGEDLASRLAALAPDICLGITFTQGNEYEPGTWSICLHSPDRTAIITGISINEGYLGTGIERLLTDGARWVAEEHARRGW
jgi:hypothetical protein